MVGLLTKAICVEARHAEELGDALNEPDMYARSIIFEDRKVRAHSYIIITGSGMPPALFSMLHPYMSMEAGMIPPRTQIQLRSRSSGTRTPRISIHFLTVWSAQRPPTKVPVCGRLCVYYQTRIHRTCNRSEPRSDVEQPRLHRRREVETGVHDVSNRCQ
jgi:hypothetical protein